MNPAQTEMSRNRLTLQTAPGGGAATSQVVEKAFLSSTTTDMEVESQPSIKLGASQTKLVFDSSIETIEIESDNPLSFTNRNSTTSSANYELPSPGLILATLQTILSVPEADYTSPQGSLSCPRAFSIASPSAHPDLVGEILAGAVSLQSPETSVRYLVSCHSRHRSVEAQFGKRGKVPPLLTVLTSTKNQIVCTLLIILRGVWSSSPPSNISPLYSLLNEEQFPYDLLLDLVSLLCCDPAALSKVFSPLLQHCLTETRMGKVVSSNYLVPLISLTRLAEVRLSSGSRSLADLLVPQPQWIPSEITQTWGLEVAGLSFLGKAK